MVHIWCITLDMDATNRPAKKDRELAQRLIGAVLCPRCNVHAIVPLTQTQLREQPDDTTLVCHPALGGCNHGFAVDAKAAR